MTLVATPLPILPTAIVSAQFPSSSPLPVASPFPSLAYVWPPPGGGKGLLHPTLWKAARGSTLR